uniref:Glutamine amidotransferase type-2 domain-containing protein n=1 Tax=viral metagenome TaxID=1070528 RepID=A0A6C0HTX8_9ZZZZ
MFIHNPFTIYLNAQFHVDEQHKISPLGIKSYYHSTNEPIMLTDSDLMIFIHGRVFNLQQLNEDSEIKESDPCRVLCTIYKTYGIEYLLQVMQGEFVMVIIDQRVELDEAKIYAVSESMGIVPLYMYMNNAASSSKEIKYIISTQPDLYGCGNAYSEGRLCCYCEAAIAWSPEEYEYECSMYPGTYAQFSLRRIVHASWTFDPRMNLQTHYTMQRLTNYMRHINYDLPNVLNHQFYLSIYDRFQYDTTTTHVCCLYHELDESSYACKAVRHDFQSCGEEDRRTRDVAENVVKASEGKSKETCTEYNILYNDLKKVCKKKNILFLDNVSTISHPETTRVFMVFGGCTTSYMCDNVSDKTNLQIDYELRDHLKTTVQTTLIPLYESFYQEHGIMLEFPWLNSEWLQLYLSLPYHCRFDM